MSTTARTQSNMHIQLQAEGRFLSVPVDVVEVWWLFVHLEHSCIGESVRGRPAESHHLPPECCAAQRGQRDHRKHHHRNSRGETYLCVSHRNPDDGTVVIPSTHFTPLFGSLIGRAYEDDWQFAPDLLQRNVWKTGGCCQGGCPHTLMPLPLCLCSEVGIVSQITYFRVKVWGQSLKIFHHVR